MRRPSKQLQIIASKPQANKRRQRLDNQQGSKLKKFKPIRKIGKGGFSEVFLGMNRSGGPRRLIIKANFSTVSHKHVLNELKNLRLVGQKCRNFPSLQGAFIECNHTFFVQDYREHTFFNDYFHSFSLTDVKHYLFQLLLCLRELKQLNIFHRDIKPDNFLYNTYARRGTIIDFGLAESALRAAKTRKRIGAKIKGTHGYIPLQVLLGEPYSFGSDIWAVGVIMLGLVCRKSSVFAHQEVIDLPELPAKWRRIVVLVLELAVFNQRSIVEQCRRFGYQLVLPKNIQSTSYANLSRIEGFGEVGNDLLCKLLDINPSTRIHTEEALAHGFFDEVRSTHVCE